MEQDRMVPCVTEVESVLRISADAEQGKSVAIDTLLVSLTTGRAANLLDIRGFHGRSNNRHAKLSIFSSPLDSSATSALVVHHRANLTHSSSPDRVIR